MNIYILLYVRWGFPSGSVGIESACNARDLGLIPGLGRCGEGNGNPLQYSCLENSMDRFRHDCATFTFICKRDNQQGPTV